MDTGVHNSRKARLRKRITESNHLITANLVSFYGKQFRSTCKVKIPSSSAPDAWNMSPSYLKQLDFDFASHSGGQRTALPFDSCTASHLHNDFRDVRDRLCESLKCCRCWPGTSRNCKYELPTAKTLVPGERAPHVVRTPAHIVSSGQDGHGRDAQIHQRLRLQIANIVMRVATKAPVSHIQIQKTHAQHVEFCNMHAPCFERYL